MLINYPSNKTKIICTVGPATNSPDMMDALLHAGMNVVRLNFSHGDFATHENYISELKKASARTGIRLAIMADLPGPKMRIGKLKKEPIELVSGEIFTLTTEDISYPVEATAMLAEIAAKTEPHRKENRELEQPELQQQMV